MTVSLALLVASVLAAVFGADLLLRGALGLARRGGASAATLAALVIALGASLPELVIVVQAIAADAPGIGYGVLIGSSLANLWLVGGLTIVVAGALTRSTGTGIALAFAFAGVALWTAHARGWAAGPLLGGAMAVTLVAYFLVAIAARRADGRRDERAGKPRAPVLIALAGLILLPAASYVALIAASDVAGQFGVSASLVGAVLIGVSAAAPELIAAFAAVMRDRRDIVLPALISAVAVNLLGGGAILALAGTTPPEVFRLYDDPILSGALVALAASLIAGQRLGRVYGIAALAAYGAYVLGLLAGVSAAPGWPLAALA